MNISEAKEELFIRLSINSNAGTAVQALSEVCPPNELWQPLFMAIENTSSESVTVTPCIVRSSDTRLMGISVSVATLTALGLAILPLVGPGERIGFSIVGTAQKSPQWLTVTGWRFKARLEPDKA